MSKAWKAKESQSAKLWQEWWPYGAVTRTPCSGAERRFIGALTRTHDHVFEDAFCPHGNEVKAEERSKWTLDTLMKVGNESFLFVSIQRRGKKGDYNSGYFAQASLACQHHTCQTHADGRQYPRVPTVLMTRNRFPWYVAVPSYYLEGFAEAVEWTGPYIQFPEFFKGHSVILTEQSTFFSSVNPAIVRKLYRKAVLKQEKSSLFRKLVKGVLLWDKHLSVAKKA